MPGTQLADLSDYVASLKREVMDPTAAASAQFTTLSTADWVGQLADSFWEARLDGVLQGYYCDESGIITAIASGNQPASPAQPWQSSAYMNWSADGQVREMVQLVILYASFRLLRNSLRAMRTAFAVAAGPVRFEYQQSAQLLTEIMRDVMNRRNLILARLSDLGTTQVTMIDSVINRDQSLLMQDTYWVSAGNTVGSGYGYGNYGGGY